MSHQTGIHASDELKVTFAKCKAQREIRCLKLSIDNEKLVCDDTRPMSSLSQNCDWKQDWRTYVVESFLPKNKPCYLLFRLKGSFDDQDLVVAPPAQPPQPVQPPVAAPRTSLASSIVSKFTGPPKLASILTGSLSGSSNNNNNHATQADNSSTTNDTSHKSAANDKSCDIPLSSSSSPSSLLDDVSKDQWLFVSWSPESSPIRDKMIYASTKSTVKQEFGSGSIFADYFCSSLDDIKVDNVRKWIERKQHIRDGHIDLNELSLNEQELQQIKLDEADVVASMMRDKNKSLPNIEMPIDDKAISALYDFKQGKSAYVQLKIDPKTETILLERNEPASGFDLAKTSIGSLTPRDHARYHLVSYSHQHQKKQTKATLFIYSIPSSGCPIKERMLYSSVKNSLLKVIQDESKIGIVVDRRIETDDPSELTGKFLYDELYPVEVAPQVIVKPKGPSKVSAATKKRVM